MKTYLAVFFSFFGIISSFAQGGSARVAYIDMEYILSQTPEYLEATGQLDERAGAWKGDVDKKKAEIKKLKENLAAERILLTRELIDEKEEEISILEDELFQYQQKRFGTSGDLITQKIMLAKPIQDQVFAVVEDIAEARKFDYVLDKNSEATMVIATKKHDISDLVLRRLATARRKQGMTRSEAKAVEEEEEKEDAMSLRQSRREEQQRRKEEAERLMKIEQKKLNDERANDVNYQKEQDAIRQREERIKEQLEKANILKQQRQDKIDARNELIKQRQLEASSQQKVGTQSNDISEKVAAQKELIKQREEEAEQKRQETAERREQIKKEKVQAMEAQKSEADRVKAERERLLKEEMERRKQNALDQDSKKPSIDIEKLREERRLAQEKRDEEQKRKREDALKRRQEMIDEAVRKDEERRQRAQKEQDDRKELILKRQEEARKQAEEASKK